MEQHYFVLISTKSLIIPNGLSETVNGRPDNTMTTKKKDTNTKNNGR